MTIEVAVKAIEVMLRQAADAANYQKFIGNMEGYWLQTGEAIGFERALAVLQAVK